MDKSLQEKKKYSYQKETSIDDEGEDIISSDTAFSRIITSILQ